MLILPKSCFIHVQKTGGTWIRKAIRSTVAGATPFAIDNDWHRGIADCPVPERFLFTFVRHPFTWFPSYWRFQTKQNWVEPTELDRLCQAETFDEFMRNVFDRCPGIYSQWIQIAVGEPRRINCVGRYENLADDLVAALRCAGEEFDEAVIRSHPPENVGDKSLPAELTDEFKAAILRTEFYVFDRFGYAA